MGIKIRAIGTAWSLYYNGDIGCDCCGWRGPENKTDCDGFCPKCGHNGPRLYNVVKDDMRKAPKLG